MALDIKDPVQQVIKKLRDPPLLFSIAFGLIIAAIGVYDYKIVWILIIPLLIVFVVGLLGSIFLRSMGATIHRDPIRTHSLTGRLKGDILANPGIYFLENRRLMLPDLRRSLVEESSQIDMLGWNFNETWFEIPRLSEAFERQLTKGESEFRLRVLLPHPDSPALKAHLADRQSLSRVPGQANRSLARYNQTIELIKGWNNKFSREIFRYLPNEIIRFGFLRFDYLMILTHYLASDRGSASPATILHEQAEITEAQMLFKRYRADFNELWDKRSVNLENDKVS